MIWQDFMFSDAIYWDNSDFLKSVNKESRDTMRQLQTHPSIAIWGANNENGIYCWQGQETEVAFRDLYWKNILDVVALYDVTRPYVSSSPSNGNETEEYPCKVYSGNNFFGDIHEYLYDQDCWNTSIYMKGRFVSEYGWQSW